MPGPRTTGGLDSTGAANLLLRVRCPDGSLSAYYLDHRSTIGRSDANTIVLKDDDQKVDRTHARVELGADGVPLLVSTSPHNTFLVNGSLTLRLRLTPGLCFQIGDYQLECVSASGDDRAKNDGCPYCGEARLPDLDGCAFPCLRCNRELMAWRLGPDHTIRLVLPALLGPWRLERFVAQGGMSAVFKASYDPGATQPDADSAPPLTGIAKDRERSPCQPRDSSVAIKVLLPNQHRASQATERFRQEMQLMATLQCPRIVKLVQAGEVGDLQYLVMEWLDGGTLRDVIADCRDRHTLPRFEDALQWMRETCEGLQALHEAGIIHRDIKPSNILLDNDGHTRIADLGIAKDLSKATAGLTTTGIVPGTYEYMAPEQWTGSQPVDQRADLYSLGATFYELLTNRRPIGSWPAASVVNSSVPAGFDLVLRKLLAPSPVDRYQSVQEVLTKLQERTCGTSHVPRYAMILAGAIVGICAGIGVGALFSVDPATALVVGTVLGAIVGALTKPD